MKDLSYQSQELGLKQTPILFIGHGSPLNAIEENSFTQMLANLRKLYSHPKAIY